MSKLANEEIERLKVIKEKLEKARDDPKFMEGLKKYMEEHQPVKGKDGVYRIKIDCKAIKADRVIGITVRGLVMCPDWRTCKYHGDKNCREIILHNSVILHLKLKRANKENALKSLGEFILKEVK